MLTGIGPESLLVPRTEGRTPDAPAVRAQFRCSIRPLYLWRTCSLQWLLPRLYLKGISVGDFEV